MATADPHDPGFYQQIIPAALAQQAAQKLGITTDQLYNYYAKVGNPNVVASPVNQNQNQGYGGAGGQTPTLITSGIEQMALAGQGQGTGSGGGGLQTSLMPSYYNQNPQISSGDGTASGGGGSTMANGTQPETAALGQMAQIDPQSEALRQQLAGSYATSLGQAQTPTAAQFQSYLDLATQVDPTTAAARQQLGTDLAAQEAMGSQLTTAQAREVDQATREAQAARGNVYGTPQLVQEAMTRGSAGLALQQQRQQALQSYLSSGQTPGDIAMSLYNQQQNQLRANQSAALGYLGSGSTPYQAGAAYYDRAQANAQTAASYGAPTYQPSALGQGYTGSGTSGYPQYGLDIGNQATNWYNSMVNQNYGLGALKNQSSAQSGAQGAAIGTGIGSALGGVVGSFVPVVGTVAGAAIGGALGGAAGRGLSA